MIELFAGTDGKRRGLLTMKRATGFIFGTRFFKRHALVDDVHHINPRENLLNEVMRNATAHPCYLSRQPLRK